MKKYLWGMIYGALLTVFTVYLLLDTFVIVRVYDVASPRQETTENIQNEIAVTDTAADSEAGKTEISHESGGLGDTDPDTDPIAPIVNVKTYEDENISIVLTEYRELETAVYVAEVALTKAEYLKTALAKDSYGRNVTQKTSVMAENNGAILAVNGDYYGSREKGFVIRNGVLYRSSASKNQEDLVIYEDGSFGIVTETEAFAEALLEDGAAQILSFGPALVVGNRIAVDEKDEVDKSMKSNPRTAIGITEAGNYLFVVSDGRTDESEGLSLYELADFMQRLGAVTAYNLDGGGSSTMYFCGEIINKPTANGQSIKERSVSDIVYIGY